MTVGDIYDYIDSFAPFSSQEEWDNSGLLVGDKTRETSRAVVCLDVNREVLQYALKIGAKLIISHHPVIFSGLKSISSDSLLFDIIRNDISIISAHTSLDKAPGGVNDALCEKLGFNYHKIFTDTKLPSFINILHPDNALAADELCSLLKKKLSCTVSYCDTGRAINKIGLCTGAGAEFSEEAQRLGCDAFITGEARYHEFLDAREKGISLFTVGHFESEILFVKMLTDRLNNEFNSAVFFEAPVANTVITEK